MKNDLLKSKHLYKLTAFIIKYLPFVLTLIQVILLGLNYFGIVFLPLSFLGGTSLLFLGLLYLLSYLFQYCSLYRIPLGYNLAVNTVVLLKAMSILDISTMGAYRLIVVITGVFALIFIYFIYKYRNNPKVGGIKAFCDKYCDC